MFKFRSVHKRMVTLFQTSDNRSGSEDELPNFIEEIEMGKMSKDIKRSQSYKVTNDYKCKFSYRRKHSSSSDKTLIRFVITK